MKSVIYNGSPRYKTSNSLMLAEKLSEGLQASGGTTVIRHLASVEERIHQREDIEEADSVILIFPLYTDSMPALVMEFIEDLYSWDVCRGKKMGFIVQSGFPEAVHTEAISEYLDRLALRLNCNYLGTVRKGAVEGIQFMPANVTKKLFNAFYELGEHLGREGEWKKSILKSFLVPYRFSPATKLLFRFFNLFGLTNMYWNKMLKRNGAWLNRFDTPYESLEKA